MTKFQTVLIALVLATPAAAPLMAQEPPRTLPPASPPPPALAPAIKLVPPPANAVAQCIDQTFVVAPAEPTACATRGGVKVVLPGARSTPAPSAVAPTVRAPTPRPSALVRDDAPPAGATMRCRDGLWLSGTPSDSRCDRNGGLAVILPAPRAVPPRAP